MCVVRSQCCSSAVSDDQQRLGSYKCSKQHGGAGCWTEPVWMFSPAGLPPRNTALLAQDHQRATGQVDLHHTLWRNAKTRAASSVCSDTNPPLQFFLSDFEKVLTQLNWPILSPPTQSLTPTANIQEISSQLDLLVKQLLALQKSYPSLWSNLAGDSPVDFTFYIPTRN